MRTCKLLLSCMLALTFAFTVTSCRSKKGAGEGDVVGGTDALNPYGVTGTDIYSQPLDERGEYTEEIAGQFQPVFYAYDSAQIQPSERMKLEAVAEYLRSEPAVGIIIEGHTDERGSNEYNLALGERRALAARAYLIGLGIDASRLQTKSFGEEMPSDPAHDESAYSANRRSEFVIFY